MFVARLHFGKKWFSDKQVNASVMYFCGLEKTYHWKKNYICGTFWTDVALSENLILIFFILFLPKQIFMPNNLPLFVHFSKHPRCLTLCMLGNFACYFVVCGFIFSNQLFKKIFSEYHQSVKQFECKSGPTFCWAWSGSKLCKGYQQTTKVTTSGERLQEVNTLYSVSYQPLLCWTFCCCFY